MENVLCLYQIWSISYGGSLSHNFNNIGYIDNRLYQFIAILDFQSFKVQFLLFQSFILTE